MKTIKFTLLGNFAFFKDKVNLRDNHSYPSIHKPALLGMLGGILGLDGFSDAKKNGYIEYLKKLSNVDIGIVINNKIDFVSVKTNDSTGLDITNVKNRTTQQTETILTNVSYDIYLKIEGKELYKEIFNALNNREFYFEPKLGKSYFPGSITDVFTFEDSEKDGFSENMDSEKEAFYVQSIFPSSFIEDIELYDIEEFYGEIGIKYRLPIKSDKISGTYIENDEFTFKNFVNKKDILENKRFKIIDEKLIYFI